MAGTNRVDGNRVGLAWITGAGTGVGRALALRLAHDGWHVAISGRRADKLEQVAAAGRPDHVHVFPLDVTDAGQVQATLAAIQKRLGPIDLAVLNAGTYRRDSAMTFDAAAFGATVDVNIMGTVHCLAAAMPGMIARGSGHIAVVASVSGYVGLPGAAAYGATKAALINMCEALYPELAAWNVQLSLVNPGFVKTPLTDRNDFPMPFLISAEAAADHVVAGLRSRRFEIAFPWKMVLSMRLLAALPAPLRFAITRRMVRNP